MSASARFGDALLRQAWLSLRLNFRAPMPVVYGYLLPVVFLFGFGGIFRAGNPPLLAEMGQLLTITILGSAALGLPTALVAERERGVWRRYRLLPVAPAALVGGVVLARFAIVAGAVALQLVLAHLVFGTPWPSQPLVFLGAALAATFAFLGLGLVIAALADGVPAVQALGQCLFLPMILLGGVGVPLAVLPIWAQRLAGFMPGRYAVAALQSGFTEMRDPVGLGAAGTGRLRPLLPPGYAWQEITDAQIATITYENLPGDNELVTRLAPPLVQPFASTRLESIAARLAVWAPALTENSGENIRHLVALAALADLAQDPQEGEIARLVYDRLRAVHPAEELRRGLAWIILCPDDGTVVTSASAFGLRREIDENAVRNRAPLYAQKFLARELGRIREP